MSAVLSVKERIIIALFLQYDRLRNATEYMINTLRAQGFNNVHTESAPIANWIRGVEVATLMSMLSILP